MDPDSGKIIGAPFPIGDRLDANAYDPETGLIAAATREGTLHIIREDSPDKCSVVETVKTEFGAKTMGLDPKTHNLYLTTSDFGPSPAPHRATAQSAASRASGYVSLSDLWALTRQLNPIGKTASPRDLFNSPRILLMNENRAQAPIESPRLDAKF